MKVIIYGDPQIKNHPDFLTVDERGLSNWVKIGYDCFMQMVDYAEKHGIDYMIGLGDMCERKDYVDNQILCTVGDILAVISDAGIYHVWVVGNHDFSNPNFPLEKAFGGVPNFEVVSRWTKKVGLDMCFLSWLQDTKEYIKILERMEGEYLFTHCNLVDVRLGSGHLLEGIFKEGDSILNKFKYIFSGHIHKPCQIGNVVYVGSMFQTDFGEVGERKRFIVLDTESGKWESVYFRYPELVQIEGIELDRNVEGCYVKYKIKLPKNAPPVNARELRKKALEAGALGVKVSVERDREERKVRYTKEQVFRKTFEDFVKDYCNEHKLDVNVILEAVEELKKND